MVDSASASTSASSAKPLPRPLVVLSQASYAKSGRKPAFVDVNLAVYPGQRLALLAFSTYETRSLLNCLCGITPPDSGSVDLQGHLSWPVGATMGLSAMLTGRQNTEFLVRIYGTPGCHQDQLNDVIELADLPGDMFDQPASRYSSNMKARLKLALSLVFDFDLYPVPRQSAWSYTSPSQRAERYSAAFDAVTRNKAIVMACDDEDMEDAYCHEGIVLIGGRICFRGGLDYCRLFMNEQRSALKGDIDSFEEEGDGFSDDEAGNSGLFDE